MFYDSVYLTFKGLGEMSEGPHETVMESPVIIHCDHYAAVTFFNCTDVSFGNITFKSCGQKFPDKNFKPALEFNDASNVSLEYLSFQNNAGAALHYWASPFKSVNLTILYSSFYRNGYGIDLLHDGPTPLYNVYMSYSNMTSNYYSGLRISYQGSIKRANIQLKNLVVANNQKNIEVFTYSNHYNININNLISFRSYFGLDLCHNVISKSKEIGCSIMIRNSSFYNHFQTGIRLEVNGFAAGRFLLISSCFRSNTGLFGTSLQIVITTKKSNTDQSFSTVLHNAIFDSNGINQSLVEYYHYSKVYALTVGIANCKKLYISNCNFSNNEGSGLGLFDSRAIFFGVNNFINNMAYRGAGLAMTANSYSYLYLNTSVSMNFINNTASHTGGACN